MNKKFKFGDKSTADFGVFIQTTPVYSYPERDTSSTHVPGRNGDVVIDNNCYKNVTRSYSIAKAIAAGTTYYSNAQTVLEWLESNKANYCRLEDDWDNGVYRLAKYTESNSFTNVYDGAITINVTFECKPQRYLLSGEEEIAKTLTNNSFDIFNTSIYKALPKIKMTGFDTQHEPDLYVLKLMDSLETRDAQQQPVYTPRNVLTSTVIKSPGSGTIIIDSDLQQITDANGNDISTSVSINGTEFPYLETKKTFFYLYPYNIETSNVLQSYNSFLNEKITSLDASNDKICYSKYKTLDMLEEEYQEKVKVESVSNMISKITETSEFSSIQSLMSDRASKTSDTSGTYEFMSPNDILSSSREEWSASGDGIDNLPSWLNYEPFGSTVDIETASKGYYLIVGSSNKISTTYPNITKKIIFLNSGVTLAEYVDNGDDITIYYYKANISTNEIALEYSHPSWVSFNVNYGDLYNTNTIVNGTYVNSIDFKTGSAGWFFVNGNGTNLFGLIQLGSKDSWNLYSSGTLLDSITWNNQKKAFVSKKGLKTSTNSTFTYKWLASVPQYDKLSEYYTIAKGDDSMTKASVTVLRNGYYRFKTNDNEYGSWVFKSANNVLIQSSELAGTDTFAIDFIEKNSENVQIITYANEENWPNWLDPEIYYKDSNNQYAKLKSASGLNATQFIFKVINGPTDSSTRNWYRGTYLNDSDEETYSEFIQITNNDTLKKKIGSSTTDMVKGPEESYYVAMVDNTNHQKLISYSDNREYSKNGTTEYKYNNNTPPTWLNVQISSTASEDDKIFYKAASAGYYKWDNNTNWIYISSEEIQKYKGLLKQQGTGSDCLGLQYSNPESDVAAAINAKFPGVADGRYVDVFNLKKDANNPSTYKRYIKESGSWHSSEFLTSVDLLETGYEDNTILMYMNTLIKYDQTYPLNNRFSMIVSETSGNPDKVTYKASVAGYFKLNYEANWKYYNQNDIIYESSIYETNTVYHLEADSNTSLSGVQFTITPRWWML